MKLSKIGNFALGRFNDQASAIKRLGLSRGFAGDIDEHKEHLILSVNNHTKTKVYCIPCLWRQHCCRLSDRSDSIPERNRQLNPILLPPLFGHRSITMF